VTLSPRLVLLIVLSMLAFAGNSLLCRIALRDTSIDAASFTAIRIAAGAMMLAIILRSRGARPTAGGSWLAGLLLFSYATFFSFAYRDMSAATGALLLFGAVQMTMMGHGLFSGERLGTVKLVGLAIALGGLITLLLPGLAAPPLLAAALMIAAGASWGVYSILGASQGSSAGNPTAATGGNFLRALPFAAALGIAGFNHGPVDMNGALYAVASGAITSALGYVLWSAASAALTSTMAGTIQLSVPAIAALGGALLLAEPLTSRLLIASAATLGGIAITIVGKRQERL
jgi:drug/metabolite transporter (DMT)-like permease